MYLKNFKKINASNIRKKFVLCPLNSNLQILSKMFLNTTVRSEKLQYTKMEIGNFKIANRDKALNIWFV